MKTSQYDFGIKMTLNSYYLDIIITDTTEILERFNQRQEIKFTMELESNYSHTVIIDVVSLIHGCPSYQVCILIGCRQIDIFVPNLIVIR